MLFNKTAKKQVVSKVRIAKGFFGKLKGLMFERKENFDYALVFEFPYESRIGTSVHMLFVFFPIDIIFLDGKKNVVDKTGLTPWKVNYTPKSAAKYFIEMPHGSASKIGIGDKIEWET